MYVRIHVCMHVRIMLLGHASSTHRHTHTHKHIYISDGRHKDTKKHTINTRTKSVSTPRQHPQPFNTCKIYFHGAHTHVHACKYTCKCLVLTINFCALVERLSISRLDVQRFGEIIQCFAVFLVNHVCRCSLVPAKKKNQKKTGMKNS